MTLIQPKLCSKLLGVKSQPLSTRFSSRLHTWRAANSSRETLRQKISDLLAKRETLLPELKKLEEALSQAQQEENQWRALLMRTSRR